MKSCPLCQRKFKTKLGLEQHRASVHNAQRSGPPQRVAAALSQPVRPRGSNVSSQQQGMVVVSRSEMLSTLSSTQAVGTAFGQIDLFPTSSSMSWLAKLVVAFERIEWLSATLVYKPFVGTTTNGSICFGVDWNSSVSLSADNARAKVQASTPVFEAPIWQTGKLPLPSSMLMSRRFYTLSSSTEKPDHQPGIVIWSMTNSPGNSEILGELWVDYRVRLSGTSA